jgi:uncharacterized protein (DUF433 family)
MVHAERIVVDPAILAGKPVVKGTRVPVELVLKHLAEELDVDAVIAAFPRLTQEDVRACIEYAEATIEGDLVYPAAAGTQTPSTG